MIRINRRELNYLLKNGIEYGEKGIISTTGHHRSWYVTESEKCKKLLKKYHNDSCLKNN